MPEELADDYGLAKQQTAEQFAAPDLPYLPRNPKNYHPQIALIGCGGISSQHLNAYKLAGFNVAALCDRNESKVKERQQQFFPEAFVTTDYREILKLENIEVVDITPHPKDRIPIIEAAIHAGKHILSQKPFVTDLDEGERLITLADKRNVKLAVNQNGRWSPHFSYIRHAISAGLIGEVVSVNFTLHWDHNWIIGTPFEEIHDLILYDFGVHWFDLAQCFFGNREAKKVQAFTVRGIEQKAKPPMLANAIIEFESGIASLNFNANVTHGQEDKTFVAGTKGSIVSVGASLSEQSVTLYTEAGFAKPDLQGTWFLQGFHGTMAELLGAIEENREPENNALDNLRGLGICFAAIESVKQGTPQVPGAIRKLPIRL
jgi:predicted dehydrogenase